MWSWSEGPWRCKICVWSGVEPFESEDGMEVAQHINDDHDIDEIMDYLCTSGKGVEKVLSTETSK